MARRSRKKKSADRLLAVGIPHREDINSAYPKDVEELLKNLREGRNWWDSSPYGGVIVDFDDAELVADDTGTPRMSMPQDPHLPTEYTDD